MEMWVVRVEQLVNLAEEQGVETDGVAADESIPERGTEATLTCVPISLPFLVLGPGVQSNAQRYVK